MSNDLRKNDLRVIRTRKIIREEMLELLKRQNFNRLTVNDLCEQAQISRPTFYAHFKDKYDLLEFWLTSIQIEIDAIVNEENSYIQIEKRLNQFVRDHAKVITNILEGANNEVLALLHDFIVSILGIPVDKSENGKFPPERIILSYFCAGGVLNLLHWQMENKFPPDLQFMNSYFYEMLMLLLTWEADRGYTMEK